MDQAEQSQQHPVIRVAVGSLELHHNQQQQQQEEEQLQVFWSNRMQEIEQSTDFKNHSLPLARIKKIMKANDEVHMISAETPLVFAKACEIFVLELTLRSWIHAEENKRRTLQRNNIAGAVSRTDVFDFLVDIVPRNELREVGPTGDSIPYYYVSQRRASDSSTTTPVLPINELAVVTPAECRTKRIHDKFNFEFDGAANTGETRAIPRPGQRRRVSDSSTTTPSLPRKELLEANNAVEFRSMVTAQCSVNKLSYSIGECIECLDGMVEIELGSDLYMFALDIFLKKEYREVFLQLKKPNVKVAWLKRMRSAGPPLPLH